MLLLLIASCSLALSCASLAAALVLLRRWPRIPVEHLVASDTSIAAMAVVLDDLHVHCKRLGRSTLHMHDVEAIVRRRSCREV